jgi:hypothetical protein
MNNSCGQLKWPLSTSSDQWLTNRTIEDGTILILYRSRPGVVCPQIGIIAWSNLVEAYLIAESMVLIKNDLVYEYGISNLASAVPHMVSEF